jgi:predicted RNA methylase
MPRIANDEYPTPNWMIQCLSDHAKIKGTIFEPCAGVGKTPIADAFAGAGYSVITNDLFSQTTDYQKDATIYNNWWVLTREDMKVADWVISNPPYGCQQKIIENAVKFARVGVAMLLRVTADEMVVSEKERDRAHWWADNPESLVIKMPRFSFAKSSKSGNWTTDSAYCQWFVWRNDGYQYANPIVRLPVDRIPGFHRKPIEELKNG